MDHLKRFLKISFLLVCLISISTNLFAQVDYIINNKGEKIIGEVKSYDVGKIKFVPKGVKKASKYKPADIKEAYKAGHGVFRSVFVPNRKKNQFLAVLEDGNIKLYEFFKNVYHGNYGSPGFGAAGGAGFNYMGGYNSPKKYWYATKGEELVEVKSNQILGSRKNRKNNLVSLIQDNKDILDRYNAEKKFNFDFIRSLIVEYNLSKSK